MDKQQIDNRLADAVSGKEANIAEAREGFTTLLSILADLRGPGGCPWDAEQSLASLRQYIREEADELVEAIDNILAFEDELRLKHGIEQANPTPPAGDDKARTEKKGLSIAHHPHRPGFDPAISASGAPLPVELSADDSKELDGLYGAMQDEMGDIMLQGAFLGDILIAMGRGGIERGLQLIVEKMIRRHPHVYGDRQVADSSEVLSNWESIKQAERDNNK